MVEYKSWKTGKPVEIANLKNFEFPPTGDKILAKGRPPLSVEVKTD
jgi:DNA-directed RNA polymerase subunit RPC12/RpoP